MSTWGLEGESQKPPLRKRLLAAFPHSLTDGIYEMSVSVREEWTRIDSITRHVARQEASLWAMGLSAVPVGREDRQWCQEYDVSIQHEIRFRQVPHRCISHPTPAPINADPSQSQPPCGSAVAVRERERERERESSRDSLTYK